MNTPPTGLPPGGTFRDDELCSAIAHDWRNFPKSSIAILRAHVAAQLQEARTSNAALEAENRALREALTDSVEVLDRANQLYQAATNMRHVHDGKSEYLWSNLDIATGRYAAVSHFSGNCNEEARIRKALAPKEGNAP